MIYRVHGCFGGVVRQLYQGENYGQALVEFETRRGDGWHALTFEQVQKWTIKP